MKLGFFTDLHVHKFKPFSGHSEDRRLHDSLNVLKRCFKVFIKHDCDYIIFLGDLLHTRKYIDKEEFNLLLDTLKEIFAWSRFRNSKLSPEKLLFLVGNHDWYNNTCTVHSLRFLTELGVKVCDVPTWTKDDYGQGNNIIAIPSMPIKQQEKFLRSVPDKKGKHLALLFIHTQPAGSQTPAGFVFKDGLDLHKYKNKFDFAFVGDPHKHQRLGKVFVVGAPMHHSFADVGERRGVLIFNTKICKTKFICINKYFPNFKIVRDASKIKPDNYYRLIIDDESEEIDYPDNVEPVYSMDEAVIDRSMDVLDVGISAEEAVQQYAKIHADDLSVERLIKVGLELLP